MIRESFMDFYSDFSEEDPEYIHEYLVAADIDIDGLQNKLLEMIEKRKAETHAVTYAEQTLQKGRKLTTVFENLKQKMSEIGKGITHGGRGGIDVTISGKKLNGSVESGSEKTEENAKNLSIIQNTQPAGKKK
jgi:hypothetical protein